jgi:hypothetical protein
MKPMASAVIERRVIGGIYLAGSLALAAVALGRADAKDQAISFLIMTTVLGATMFWFSDRRFVSEIVARAHELTRANHEQPWRTRCRVALVAVFALAAIAGLVWWTDDPGLGGGLLAGFGGPTLFTAHRLRRWERSHGVRVLHEPRWYRIVDSGEFRVVRNAGV